MHRTASSDRLARQVWCKHQTLQASTGAEVGSVLLAQNRTVAAASTVLSFATGSLTICSGADAHPNQASLLTYHELSSRCSLQMKRSACASAALRFARRSSQAEKHGLQILTRTRRRR